MKHSQKEIINALKTLKETCFEHRCEICPFGNDNAECMLMNFTPEDYVINETTVWRAFE